MFHKAEILKQACLPVGRFRMIIFGQLIEGNADVVFGSRFKGGEAHRVLLFWHYVGNKILTFMANMFSNLNLTDIEVCYKVFKREILEKIELKENRFGFDPEFTLKVARLGCRVYEVGVSYAGRTYNEGKKITWHDGIRVFYVILKYGIFYWKNQKKRLYTADRHRDSTKPVAH